MPGDPRIYKMGNSGHRRDLVFLSTFHCQLVDSGYGLYPIHPSRICPADRLFKLSRYSKTTRLGLKFLSIKDRIPPWDFVIAVIACFSAVYIAVDYYGVTHRAGAPNHPRYRRRTDPAGAAAGGRPAGHRPGPVDHRSFFLHLRLFRTLHAGCDCL